MSDSVSKYDVEYSPDGTKFAYIESVSSTPQVFIAQADGTNPQQITSGGGIKYTPSWSPDGTKLLFSQAVSSQVHIFRINIDGTDSTEITSTGVYYDPEYSPDGTKIIALFASTDDEIYIMDADGSDVVNITNNGVDEREANWSPNGQKIVYSSATGGFQELFMMNPDGSSSTQLTADGKGYHSPVFSPDGTKLAFIDTLAPSIIYVSDTDGSDILEIPVGWGRELSWQPLTLAPISSNPNPNVSLSDGKATIAIPALYTDRYEGIDNATVAVTSTPASGTTSVDSATGVITYTPRAATASLSPWTRLMRALLPTAHAAPTDSFTYQVCSQTNSALCSSGTITVNLLSSPATGFGRPDGSSSLAWALGAFSIISIGLGLHSMLRLKRAKV